VSSIAMVHETLSVSIDESVDFDEIVDRLLGMLSDVTGSEHVVLTRSGTFGDLAAEQATALVLVLTELIQNAIEHGFRAGQAGSAEVRAARSRGRLSVSIIDNVSGLPSGFSAEATDRLGLQIVRTLVSAELGGTIEIRQRTDGQSGTEALLSVPVVRRTGTD